MLLEAAPGLLEVLLDVPPGGSAGAAALEVAQAVGDEDGSCVPGCTPTMIGGWRELGDLLYSVYYLSLPLQTVLTVVTENLLLRAAGQLFG